MTICLVKAHLLDKLKMKKRILIFIVLIAAAVIFSACHFGTDESFELSINDSTKDTAFVVKFTFDDSTKSYEPINPEKTVTINCEQEVTKIEFFSGANFQTNEMYLKATYSRRIKHTTTLTISETSDGNYVVK